MSPSLSATFSRSHGMWLGLYLLNAFVQVECSPSHFDLPTTPGEKNLLSFDSSTIDETDNRVQVQMNVAPVGKLVTLHRVSSDQYVPVLRSYDGHDWENVAGADILKQFEMSCTSGDACSFWLDSQETYYVTMYDHSLGDQKDEVARFLERTTFGPRKSDLDNWNLEDLPYSFATYVKHQIENVPTNQHKEFFRKRLNSEATEVSKISYPGPRACERYSRWRRYALHWEDMYYKDTQKIEVEIVTSGNETGYVLKIAGQVRTVLTEPFSWYQDSWNFHRVDIGGQFNMSNGPFEICHSPYYFKKTGLFEIDGSRGDPLVRSLFLKNPEDASCVGIVNGNPTVNLDPKFVDMSNLHLLNLSAATLHVVNEDMTFGSDLILNESITDEDCDTFPDITSVFHWQKDKADKRHPPVFGELSDGGYVIHSPRKQFLENTIENPAMDGGGNMAVETAKRYKDQYVHTLFCSNIQQNIFNEEGCKLSYEPNACSKNHFDNMHMLSAPHLARIFTQTNRYVYAISDLRLSEDHLPCANGTRSRWVPTDCSGPNVTLSISLAVANALYEQRDDNAELRDIIFQDSCETEDLSKNEMTVYVEEEDQCFKTVHPDHMSVYDLTEFAAKQTNSDFQFSNYKNEGVLPFPTSVAMSVFDNRESADWHYVGRFGDVVRDYDIFPDSHHRRYQIYGYSFQAVSDLGIQEDPAKGVLVCGSQGEAAPDPMLGEHFDVLETTTNPFGPDFNVQKKNVWTMLALYGEDQLRQRVAWALSQILVVDPNVLNDPWATEPNTSFYDIFVRNALGNYRDVLREVAFHSKMAAFLTFLNSASMAHNWHTPRIRKLLHPDENFAREFLQLFSIGLVKLHEDGTPQLDRRGVPIPTYDTVDIVSFARAWTGFGQSRRRGNTEEQDHVGESRMDPLTINRDKRDWWPKRGLDGKFIGDRYPLCTDLPEKHFLKKGARYRLLGASSTPKWHYDPIEWDGNTGKERMVIDTNSPLYRKLCTETEGEQGCTFDSIVTLNSNIECHGNECLVDTVRVIQLAPNIFYEYLRVPCVHLAYYDNARQMSAGWLNSANMCGNPLLASAGESCCGLYEETKYWNKNRPDRVCEYTGERLTFASAIDRCSEHGGYLCDNQQYVDDDVKNQQCYTTSYDGGRSEYSNWLWTRGSCSLKALVQKNGLVAVVHKPELSLKRAWPPGQLPEVPSYVHALETVDYFSVHWPKNPFGDDLFPTVETNDCDEGCFGTENDECLCDTHVVETQVFYQLPTREEILEQLHIGAFPIDMFSDGDYELIESQDGVDVYRRNTMVPAYEPPPPPPYENPSCEGNLIPFNHDFESGRTNGFIQVNNELYITSPGYNSSYAAIVPNRDWTGEGMLSANTNLKCLPANSTIRIDFDYQLLRNGTNETLVCTNWWQCVYVSVHVAIWTNEDKTEYADVAHYQGIHPKEPFPNPEQGEWSHYSENFTIPNWDLGYGYKYFQFYFWGGTGSVDEPTDLIMDNIRVEQLSTVQSTPINRTTEPSTSPFHNYSEHTVFKVTDEYGKPAFLKNLISTVQVGSNHSLRNPPGFFDIADPEARDAYYETDAVTDHVLYHDNTGPFLSRILMQHLGISNPSPRYIQAAAQAFKSGQYTWTDNSRNVTFGDGRWGCLASTVAAIVLDREAMSVVLDADPAHGSLKEPLLKVVGLMRSMDYTRTPHAKLNTAMLRSGLRNSIGQMPYEAPNVFSFFAPDYSPGGQFAQASLVSPEAQVLSMVETIHMSNGLFSLINNGLLSCNGGFGGQIWIAQSHGCQMPFGRLELSADGANSTNVINELASLLTSGRLSHSSREYIAQQYDAIDDEANALRVAQQLIVMSPEFQSTNLIRPTGEERQVTAPTPSNGSPYKAIVYAYLFGGMDSFYMLSPHSDCIHYTEYEEIRTSTAKLDSQHMVLIDATSSNQPCKHFGLHKNLIDFKNLYDSGDAVFLANTGHLAKPVTKSNWRTETRGQLFSHFSMMQEAEYVDAFREKAGTGVLGRMLDKLQEKGYSVGSVGINSAGVILDGDASLARSSDVVSSWGITQLYPQAASGSDKTAMMNHFFSLNGATKANSGLYGNHWSQKFIDSANKTDTLKNLMNFDTTITFGGDHFSTQLKTAAKMITKHEERGVNRDAFFIFLGGFDHHFNMKASLPGAFTQLNNGIRDFHKELQERNLVENVTLVLSSEFGRTLTPNSGVGTDHAWGGNYFIMGGGLNGSRILGHYPEGFGEDDPTNDGRGRLIPTTSWDSLWNGISQWFGVTEEDDLNYVLPNRKNFGCLLLNDKDLYIDGQQTTPGCGGNTVKFSHPFILREARYLNGEEQKAYCKILEIAMSHLVGNTTVRCVITDQTIRLEKSTYQLDVQAQDVRRLDNSTFEIDVQAELSTDVPNVTNAEVTDAINQNRDFITNATAAIINDLVEVGSGVAVTNAPTGVPSAAPSTSMEPSQSQQPTDGDFDHWDIKPFHGSDVVFSDDRNTDEIVFYFNISNRDVGIRFYESDCKTAVNSTFLDAIVEKEAGSPSKYMNASVKIDAKPENMVNSPNLLVLDPNTNKATMSFCFRMDMTLKPQDGEAVSVNFHETKVTVIIDMVRGFRIESISSDRDQAENVDKDATVDYYVDSYQCNSDYDRETIELNQGSQLFVCIETNSTQAVFDKVVSLNLNQIDGGVSDPITSELGANGLTSVIMQNDNKKIVVRTMMISKFFTVGNSNPVAASGEVLFKFSDSIADGRRRRAVAGTNGGAAQVNGQLQESQRSLLDKDDSGANQDEYQPTTDFRVMVGIAQRSNDNNGGESIKEADDEQYDKKAVVLVSVGLIGIPCTIAFFILATWWFVVNKRSGKEADETFDLMLEEAKQPIPSTAASDEDPRKII